MEEIAQSDSSLLALSPKKGRFWKRNGEVLCAGIPEFPVRTNYISGEGISFFSMRPINIGQHCVIKVPTLYKGKINLLEAQGSIDFCTLCGMQGFRVGVRFKDLNKNSKELVEAIIENSYW